MKKLKLINWIRKRRTIAFKVAFPALVVEDFLTGKKPHELLFWEDMNVMGMLGLTLIIAGVLIRFWARGHFAKGRLFTSGPYAIIRHPLYFGSTLVMLGVLCILNDWLNWSVIVPMIILFHGAAILYEEQSLANRFGRQWQEYTTKVPAIIPSINRHLLSDSADRWSWRVYCNTTEKITTAMFVSLPVLLELFEELAF